MKNIITFELKRLIKSKLFYLIGFILSMAIIIENPIAASTINQGDLIWSFINSVRMLTVFSAPLIISNAFIELKPDPLKHMVLIQPVSKQSLLLGKLITIFVTYIIWYTVSALIYSMLFLSKFNVIYVFSILSGIIFNYILVIVPVLIILVLIGSYLFIRYPNIIILYVSFLLVLIITSYINPILDFTMKNKIYSKAMMIDDLIDNRILYNRIFSLFLILIFSILLVKKYVSKSENIHKKLSRWNKLISAFSNLIEKIVGINKILINIEILPLIIFLILQFIYSIYKNSYMDWIRLQMFLILLPPVIIIDSLSEIYENKRQGYILTSNISAYKLMEKRLLLKFSISTTFIFVIFNIAYFIGLEYQYERIFILIITSCFLSILGLSIANITKKTIYGYSIFIFLWILPMVGGQRLSERIYFLSTSLPIQVYSMILWESLFIMALITILIYIINLLMLSKNEMKNKSKIFYILGGIILILLILVPTYKEHNKYFSADCILMKEAHKGLSINYESNIPKESVENIVIAFNVLKDSYSKYFDSISDINSLYYIRNEDSLSNLELTEKDLIITYSHLIELNPSKYNINSNEYIKLTKEILKMEGIFNLPENVEEGLNNYLVYGIASKNIPNYIPESYREKYYSDLLSEDYSKYFIDKIQNSDNDSDIFSSIFQETELVIGSVKMSELYREIGNNISQYNQLEDLKEIFLRYNANSKNINNKFNKLEKYQNKGV